MDFTVRCLSFLLLCSVVSSAVVNRSLTTTGNSDGVVHQLVDIVVEMRTKLANMEAAIDQKANESQSIIDVYLHYVIQVQCVFYLHV